MSSLMEITLVTDWGGFKAGKTLTHVPAGQARLMISRKIAVKGKPKRKAKRPRKTNVSG